MSEINEYQLFMKMLEIIELKQRESLQSPTENERSEITNIIKNIEGHLILSQGKTQEVLVNMEGDKFENISNSIIATRGSIASGIIKIRDNEGDEVADALLQIEKAISQVDPEQMSDSEKEKALQLLDEFTKQASAPNKTKVVLEALGKSVWAAIEKVEPLVKVAKTAWPLIEKIWQ